MTQSASTDITETKPFLLVGNPTSQSGAAAKRIVNVIDMMGRMGLAHEYRSTLPDGKTVQMVLDALNTNRFDTVVYMGGDGTFYEVAKAICSYPNPGDIRLGMLPSGTANDQGKSFGISSAEKELKKNIRIITDGHTERLDVGTVTAFDDHGNKLSTDLFFDSIGWGLSAAILAFRNRELQMIKKVPRLAELYRDHAVYWRAGVHELAKHWVTQDKFSAEIEIDGEVTTMSNLSDLVVNNTAVYASEWVIDPASSPNDGMMEVAPFSGVRDWTSKMIINSKKNPLTVEILNKFGLVHGPNLRGKKIKIQILRPKIDKRLPAQRDGEEFMQSDHFHIEVLPRLLTVIAPKNFHWI